jgi:hypothetical protein
VWLHENRAGKTTKHGRKVKGVSSNAKPTRRVCYIGVRATKAATKTAGRNEKAAKQNTQARPVQEIRYQD